MDKSKKCIIPWLPNVCTTLSFLFGFLAITSAAAGNIEKSCYCIFFAAITDFLDGRVARITGSESEFGAAYDSLADLIAFGVAPALISYYGHLINLGKLGWFLAFIYATATCLRLARFNTSEPTLGAFIGMPCPAAALLIASLILLTKNLSVYYLVIHILLAAVLQVSPVPFKHTKNLKVSANHRLLAILGLVFILSAAFLYPAVIIYTLMSFYIIYSLVRFFLVKI